MTPLLKTVIIKCFQSLLLQRSSLLCLRFPFYKEHSRLKAFTQRCFRFCTVLTVKFGPVDTWTTKFGAGCRMSSLDLLQEDGCSLCSLLRPWSVWSSFNSDHETPTVWCLFLWSHYFLRTWPHSACPFQMGLFTVGDMRDRDIVKCIIDCYCTMEIRIRSAAHLL